MCGIAGIYSGGPATGGGEPERHLVRRMTDVLAHRGPDAQGHWQDERGRCTLGHRRLSIIDVSTAGAQPMSAPSSPWVLTYNGEVYNYLALRAELESEGVVFTGHSDTEVLLWAITRWGPDCIERLDGMFALAAFNTATGELLLARDPFGEKPLYYCDAGTEGVAFASELNALALLPWFSRSVSRERMAELLMFQYIGAPRAIFDDAKKLPPGHVARFVPGRAPEIRRYFGFTPHEPDDSDETLWGAADRLEELLSESLERRLMSDVPLGALLSGGVDSAVACALVRRRLGVPLKTFSLGFEGAPESETDVARAFAEAIGSDHHELTVDADAVDFLRFVGEHLDEPNGDVSCFPTYLLAKLVREHVTVAISGDGGDEMFGGYGRYFATLDETAARPLAPLGGNYYSDQVLVATELEVRALLGEVPEGLRRHLAQLRAEVEQQRSEPLAAMRRTDAANYMPGAVLAKVDRMSMQHSLEVRTPYLNPDVAEFAAALPERLLVRGGHGKLVLREVAYRHLPRDLIDLPKKGFGLPSEAWATGPLSELAREMLSGSESRLRRVFGPERTDNFLHRPFRLGPIWGLLALESWARAHDPDLEEVGSAAAPGRRLEPRRPSARRRVAKWLTDETLLLVDEDFTDKTAFEEIDGQTRIGSAVTQRTVDVLRALRPLIGAEAPREAAGWIELPATELPKDAFAAVGLDVAGARVVWLRSDALVEHGRPRGSVRAGGGGLSVSLGLQTWQAGSTGLRSEAIRLTGSDALLVANPLDDSTSLPIVAHHRRASPRRLRRAALRRPDTLGPPREPAPHEADRLVYDIESAPGPRPAREGQPRVTLTTHALPPGGAERQWCYLAMGLAEAGVETQFVATDTLRGREAHYAPMLKRAGIPVIELPHVDAGTLLEGVTGGDLVSDVQVQPTGVSDAALRLAAVFRVQEPDAVLGQLDQTNVLTGLAGVRAGVPTVLLSFRNYNPDNFSYLRTDWYRPSYRALAERPEVVLSGNSRAGNDDYAGWIGVDTSTVHTIPNAISLETISLRSPANGLDDLRRELGIRSSDKLALGVFRLSEEKRPDLFVEACARAAHRIPELRVLIAGVGGLEERVRQLGSLYGLADRLTVLGARQDVADLLRLSDVLLVTSRFEGMPNVVLESLVLGVPVVAADVGAVAELVEDRRTGIVVSSDAAEDFADGLVEVLSDSESWKARCRAASETLAERFSIERMVADYLAISTNGRPSASDP